MKINLNFAKQSQNMLIYINHFVMYKMKKIFLEQNAMSGKTVITISVNIMNKINNLTYGGD